MTSLDDLQAQLAAVLAQKAALEKQLLDGKRHERDDAIALIVRLMHEHGVVLGDLKAPSARGKGPRIKSTVKSKVAPKFRNPETGATRTGRGLRPRWLVAALASGATLELFRL